MKQLFCAILDKWPTLFLGVLILGLFKLVGIGLLLFYPKAKEVKAMVQPAPAVAEVKKTSKQSPKDKPKPDKAKPVNQDLAKEIARIKAKEKALAEKEASLKALEAKINAKLKELKQLEASIRKMLEEADVLKNKKIKHLVDVYSNMKPRQAAQVLETLDEKLAVKILAGMRGRKAGEILSYVKPDKAAKLSEELTKLQTPFK